MIKIDGYCPVCKKVTIICPILFKDQIPVRGTCIECKEELEWEPGDIYLSEFKPEDMKESESPTAIVTITVSDDNAKRSSIEPNVPQGSNSGHDDGIGTQVHSSPSSSESGQHTRIGEHREEGEKDSSEKREGWSDGVCYPVRPGIPIQNNPSTGRESAPIDSTPKYISYIEGTSVEGSDSGLREDQGGGTEENGSTGAKDHKGDSSSKLGEHDLGGEGG